MKTSKAKLPDTVGSYIAGFAPDVRAKLEAIRTAIQSAVPEAQQSISYRIPTFKLGGRPLLYFAAFKSHIGLYPVTDDVKQHFAKDLTGYQMSKGTVRFPLDQRIPVTLITRIAKFKAVQIRELSKPKKAKPTETAKPGQKSKPLSKAR